MIFGRIGKARPELRWWLRGTFLACSVVALAGFWWTSLRDTEVNEQVVTGVAASELSAAELGSADPLAPQPEPAAEPAASPPRRPSATSSSAPARSGPSRTAHRARRAS